MTQAQENLKEPRVNVSITGEDATQTEHLRALLEKRLNKRLSMAQVFKQLVKDAVQSELERLKADVDNTAFPFK